MDMLCILVTMGSYNRICVTCWTQCLYLKWLLFRASYNMHQQSRGSKVKIGRRGMHLESRYKAGKGLVRKKKLKFELPDFLWWCCGWCSVWQQCCNGNGGSGRAEIWCVTMRRTNENGPSDKTSPRSTIISSQPVWDTWGMMLVDLCRRSANINECMHAWIFDKDWWRAKDTWPNYDRHGGLDFLHTDSLADCLTVINRLSTDLTKFGPPWRS
jgi:hypothetical protein